MAINGNGSWLKQIAIWLIVMGVGGGVGFATSQISTGSDVSRHLIEIERRVKLLEESSTQVMLATLIERVTALKEDVRSIKAELAELRASIHRVPSNYSVGRPPTRPFPTELGD